MQPFQITLFTKDGCTLCVKVETILERLSLFYPLVVEEFDITTDDAIYAKYGDKIPVLHVDGVEAFVSKVSEHWLRQYFEEHKAGKM